MKIFNYFMAVILSICMVSCGGKKENSDEAIVLTPETTHIKGDLGDCFEVVEKEYTVTDDWGDMVAIEVKRTDADFPFNTKGVEPYGTYGQGVTGNAGFGIEILDENGNVIEKTAATDSGLSGMYSSDDMKEALKLRAGETCAVRWSFHFDSEKKPVKFRLTSAYEEVESSDWDSSSNDSDDDEISSDDDDSDSYSDSSSSGSEDWDALLDSYEKFVDKYIIYMKKAAGGDLSAISEYTSLMEKAEEIGDKLDKAGDDLSSSQMNRYMKITEKMTKAAFE